jgi:hypothetical protein
MKHKHALTVLSAAVVNRNNGGVFHDGAPTDKDDELAGERVWLTDGGPFQNREESAKRTKTKIAFEEWWKKLNKGDRLPRGKYFKGQVKQNFVYPVMRMIREEQKRGTFELLNIPFPKSAPRGLPW